MTDNIIKFQKPVDLHKELNHRMNVIGLAERIYLKLSDKHPLDPYYDVDKCIEWAEAFHAKARVYYEVIINKIEKIEKEAK